MRRVAVDFDGTLVEDDHWPEMGDWLPGSKWALRKLAEEFDEVVIWTCRTAEVDTDEITHRDNVDQIRAIEDMLYGLPENIYVWTKAYKPPAEAYIDNRARRFDEDWAKVIEEISPPLDSGDPGDEHVEGHRVSLNAHDIVERNIDALAAEISSHNKTLRSLGEQIRTFPTGATRDTDEGKYDYEGFLSPAVLRRYAEYMHKHRVQSDGTLRPSDNWQKGIPLEAYMKSGWRHFMEWWKDHRDFALHTGDSTIALEEALCAMLFNVQGYLHELLDDRVS